MSDFLAVLFKLISKELSGSILFVGNTSDLKRTSRQFGLSKSLNVSKATPVEYYISDQLLYYSLSCRNTFNNLVASNSRIWELSYLPNNITYLWLNLQLLDYGTS